jgi:hypothetical protein
MNRLGDRNSADYYANIYRQLGGGQ